MPEEQQARRDSDGENVFALIAKLARRSSDGQLVAAAAVGIVAAASIGLFIPSWWFAALPLLCTGSFGIWGIAERTAAERLAKAGPSFGGRRALAAVRVTAAMMGTIAAALTILTLAAMAIGTWRS